jgi:AhpD family alkylhydroperoxidase
MFTVGSQLKRASEILANLSDYRNCFRNSTIGMDFQESIKLAVAHVNDCRYCLYAHSMLARGAGMSSEAVEGLKTGEWRHIPENRHAVLAFARHYAETQGAYEPQMWQAVVDAYGSDAAREILMHTRFMMFSNLTGNTLDALVWRCTGGRVEGSTVVSELLVVLCGLMFIGLVELYVLAGKLVSRVLTLQLNR